MSSSKAFKEDTGFCVESKIDAMVKIVRDVTSPSGMESRFDQDTKDFQNDRKMEAVGRSIASLSTSAVRSPTSDIGQANYADVECAASASPGRFGAGDMFSYFDAGILGPNAGAILGLGK